MRQEWVDTTRGIGIILVVYGHVLRGLASANLPINLNYFLISDRTLYSFHMPLFFILSGYFFEASVRKYELFYFIKNKITVYIYPYLLWSFIQTSVEVLLSRYTNAGTDIQEFWRIFYDPRAQFWFLIALFNITVLIASLYYLASKYYLFVALGIWLMYKLISNYWDVTSNSLEYMVFFIFGILLNKRKLEKYFLSPITALILLLVVILFFVVYSWYYSNLLIKFFLGILGALAVITTSMHIKSYNKYLIYCGQRSLPIYLVHILAGSGTRIFLYKFLGVTSIIVHIAMGTLLGIIVPLIIYWITIRISFKGLFYYPDNWQRKMSMNR